MKRPDAERRTRGKPRKRMPPSTGRNIHEVPPTRLPVFPSSPPPPAQDWLIWQLADSAFPTGGFAHSSGLEAAWQHGEVRNREELASFLETSLRQAGSAALPLVAAAHDEPARLEEFDHLCDAFTTNHVVNRASRAQGRALLAAIERTLRTPNSELRTPHSALRIPHSEFFHLAPVFGAVTRSLEIPRDVALRLFVFLHLRSLLASAVRLNIVGPMEAQAMQFRFSAIAERLLADSVSLAVEALAQTAPLLDLWQGTQDRLYSRLFQS